MRPLRPRPVLSQSALNDLAVLTTAIGLRHGWSSPPSLKHITIAQDPPADPSSRAMPLERLRLPSFGQPVHRGGPAGELVLGDAAVDDLCR